MNLIGVPTGTTLPPTIEVADDDVIDLDEYEEEEQQMDASPPRMEGSPPTFVLTDTSSSSSGVKLLPDDKPKSEISGPKGRYADVLIARDLPDLVPEPQPLLPSIDGFLIYRGFVDMVGRVLVVMC